MVCKILRNEEELEVALDLKSGAGLFLPDLLCPLREAA